jgi:biopolymer transport protein ExbD
MSAFRHVQRRKAQARRSRPATLNLVSLMDIFTILVFFLMVNSTDVEVITPTPGIRLPDSSADQRPQQQLVISISRESLLVEGQPVAAIADLGTVPEGVIDPLRDALAERAATAGKIPEGGFGVTILGDQEIPYWLLKRIMLTCQTTDYARISLGVNRPEGAEA